MIKSRIEDYDERLKRKVVDQYLNYNKVKKIEKRFNLSRNELLAILLDSGISDLELKKYLTSLSIYDNSFIVISDTHIGSKLEQIEYLKKVYDFAIRNEIKHIVHAGDLLQSTIRPVDPKYITVASQIEHLLNVYPESKNVLNHILLGNHDYHILKKEDNSMNILNSRKDFDILGFKKVYITWNNCLLSVSHDVSSYHLRIPNIDTLLRFAGHRHSLHIIGDSTCYVPTLSDDIKENSGNNEPGFLLVKKVGNFMKVFHITFEFDDKIKLNDNGIIISKRLTSKNRI